MTTYSSVMPRAPMNMKTVVAATKMMDFSSNCQTRLLSSITAITAQLPNSFSPPNTLLKIYSSFCINDFDDPFPRHLVHMGESAKKEK